MSRLEIKNTLEKLTEVIESITNDKIKSIQKTLLNLVEVLVSDNDQLRADNQALRNEINRLKGEQGKPNIRPQIGSSTNISSELERRCGKKKKDKKSKKKKHKIRIDRVEICDIDITQLPKDVIFKGYQTVVVQDITIKTDNIKFRKKIYYSPSLKKTFIAQLPTGFQGEFGPQIKTLILNLYHDSNMTEPAIRAFLETHGIFISAATVSRILTDDKEDFHHEKSDIVQAGLASSSYQHVDDTGARVNGKNHYTHVLCNPFFTAYFTTPHKDRLTILEILSQDELTFLFDEKAFAVMEEMKLPSKPLERLQHILIVKKLLNKSMNQKVLDGLLANIFPNPSKHQTNRKIIKEASAIAAYQQLPHAISSLVCDDAPQFKLITQLLGLCWIHEGRHYKKLEPIVPLHRKQLEQFRDKFWVYYHQLLDYRNSPNPLLITPLAAKFDRLFSTRTGYVELDARIEKTQNKKTQLLLVLEHPEIPLHNNPAELGARAQARKRDISLQTKNEKGTQAKDSLMTVVQTAKKLGINVFSYLHDRISKKFEMPSLASLISSRGKLLTCKGSRPMCGKIYDLEHQHESVWYPSF